MPYLLYMKATFSGPPTHSFQLKKRYWYFKLLNNCTRQNLVMLKIRKVNMHVIDIYEDELNEKEKRKKEI